MFKGFLEALRTFTHRHGNLDTERVGQAESVPPSESRTPVDPPPPSGASGNVAAEFLAWSQAQAKQFEEQVFNPFVDEYFVE